MRGIKSDQSCMLCQGERYTLVYFAQPARNTLVEVSLFLPLQHADASRHHILLHLLVETTLTNASEIIVRSNDHFADNAWHGMACTNAPQLRS